MIERHDSVVVVTFVRALLPVMQLFALYVLIYGHYGPGGGFQAGVMLGAGYILLALALGREVFSAGDGSFRLQVATPLSEVAVELSDDRGNRAGFVVSLRGGKLLRRF